MESTSGQLAASTDFIARYGDEERLSADSIRSSQAVELTELLRHRGLGVRGFTP